MVNPTSLGLNGVPVKVRFADISSTATFQDDDAREPVRNLNLTPSKDQTAVELNGQVVWRRFGLDDPEPDKHGRINTGGGRFTVRQSDIDALIAAGTIPRAPQTGDFVEQLGKITGLWFVDNVAPAGHYSDQGGHTLLRVWYEDREPRKIG